MVGQPGEASQGTLPGDVWYINYECAGLRTCQGWNQLPMSRKLVQIKNENFQGFGCSECNWVFNPSGPVVGASLDEMKRKYEAQRDKEFAAHVCTKTLRGTNPKPD
jgi:hypothetical protein